MNVNPYIRQRRRSNLGKRYRPGQQEPPRAAPVFPTSTNVSGLSRLRSAKKTNLLSKASREYIEAKKRLMFLRTSDSNSEDSISVQKAGSSSSFFSSPPCSSYDHADNSLNMTGINCIKSPSPERNISVKKPNINISLFDELEPPKSPGPSLYDQIIFNELVALKPPVDPEESVLHFGNLILEDKPTALSKYAPETNSTSIKTNNPSLIEPKNFSPSLSSTCIGSFSPNNDKKSNSVGISEVKRSGKKLNTISEDLDTTDSFLLAEQNLLDQNQTIVASEITMVDKDVKLNLLNCKTAESKLGANVSNLEKNVSDSDEELEKIIDEIDQGLKDIHKMKNRMVGLKSSLETFMKKRRQKRNKIISDNKENLPNEAIAIEKVPQTSCRKSQNNWICSLKTDNPRLLKTPKMVKGNKTNISFADQSTIWTPHSMSILLHEQIEDLFD